MKPTPIRATPQLHRSLLWCVTAIMALVAPAAAGPASVKVVIDTTPVSGQQGSLILDYVDGDGPGATLVVRSFATDAAASDAVISGDVTGTLVSGPVSLGDSQFFSNIVQPLTFGTFISFEVDVAGSATGTPFPGALSAFLADETGTPFSSADPLGADALEQIEVRPGGLYATIFGSPFAGCTGDCHRDHQVTVDEILTMVSIALGNTDVSECTVGDANHDGQITIDEILSAVKNALNGCPVPPGTETPTFSPTPTQTLAPTLAVTSTPTRTATPTAGAQTPLERSPPDRPQPRRELRHRCRHLAPPQLRPAPRL